MLNEGRFALPKLQRAFVWSGPKAAKLLDSIYVGMPIGALTIWDTSKKNRELLRVTTKVLPAFRDYNSRVWFLLDGQQRLSVLHRVQEGGVVKNGAHRDVDFERVVFRVTDGNDGPRFQYRKPVDRTWVAMTEIVASDWKSRLRGLTNGQLNRAQECRGRLLAYKVPVVRVETEDIDEARELFLRINSAGTLIGAADRAFARAAEFDLRERAEQAWERLPPEYQGLTNEVILQARALLDGFDDVGAEAMAKVVKLWDDRVCADRVRETKQFAKTWDAQQAATKRALDLLKTRFHVLDDGLLPSQYMVATLTVFFYSRPKQPTAEQLKEIRKWFWGTALGQRYSGRGYRQNILHDTEFFKKLATTGSGTFKLVDLIEPSEIRRASYGKRSSMADAFFCLLIAQQPRHLTNGTPMQMTAFASHANRRHRHHIFPRQLLRLHSVGSSRLNSILNLCFIPAEENSGFGARAPSKYLQPFTDKRHFAGVMRRHLVPYDEPNAGIWDSKIVRGYAAFLRQRDVLVCSAFEHEAGCRLFRRER